MKTKSNDNIILIGPLATGKSSVAEKLSEITRLYNYPIDKLKWYYRFKNGYDLHISTEILKSQGFEALLSHVEPYFGPNELRKILYDFQGIIDLGASDSYCNDLRKRRKLESIFQNFQNVFLILPSQCEQICVNVLNERLVKRYENDELKAPIIDSYIKMNEKFINSDFNRKIAKHTIYTEGRSIESLAKEIARKSQFTNYERAVFNI
ncbi:MAG: hypothetical protein H8E16_22355 [Flavobacteriales bacterium]|nr:hypothetical protein [Flavobacteriales bacterium]